MTACSRQSTGPYVKPTPPRVDCKKQATPPIPPAPRKEEWVLDGMLSERAALWVVELLGIADMERELRGVEHDCLDDHEKRGVIVQ